MKKIDIMMKWRVISSPGASEDVGELVKDLNVRRVMLVTDRGIRNANLDEGVLKSLKSHNLDVLVFDEVSSNPTTKNVEDGVSLAEQFQPDIFVALGGGSPMDTAKGINIVYGRGGNIKDYKGNVTGGPSLLPTLAIPTTAGTGSEVSPFLLISDVETHSKIVIRDVAAVPKITILDPSLTVSLPRRITILSGVDALVHGIEAYVAKGANCYSQTMAMEAIELIYDNLPVVVEQPDDILGRWKMLVGSNLAGMAFAISYLGLAHSLANPLTRVRDIAHGMAVGIMLPYVIVFNEPIACEEYMHIASRLFGSNCASDPKKATRQLASEIQKFILNLGFPDNLRKLGIPDNNMEEMAKEALSQATVKSNPRKPTFNDILDIYQHALKGARIL